MKRPLRNAIVLAMVAVVCSAMVSSAAAQTRHGTGPSTSSRRVEHRARGVFDPTSYGESGQTQYNSGQYNGYGGNNYAGSGYSGAGYNNSGYGNWNFGMTTQQNFGQRDFGQGPNFRRGAVPGTISDKPQPAGKLETPPTIDKPASASSSDATSPSAASVTDEYLNEQHDD